MAKRGRRQAAGPADPSQSPANRAFFRFTNDADRQDLTAAAEKKRSGQPLDRHDRSLLRRFEQYKAEEWHRDHLRAVPQKLFCEMARKLQCKQLQEWESRYGAPVAQDTINLYEVFAWLRQFLADLRGLERYNAELHREQLRAVPQKLFCEMARKLQWKQLQDWEARYGAPVARDTINLYEVFAWLRQFLADNCRKLAADDDEDPLLAGVASPALEEYRRWKAKAAKLDVQERERSLLRRDEMRAMHGRVAGILRQAGATLGRRFGVEAQTILDEALDDVERDVRDFFSDGNHNDEPGT